MSEDESKTRFDRETLKILALVFLVFIAGFILGCWFCSAGDTGNLTVNVVDENGDPIPSATVSLDGGTFLPTNDTGTNSNQANARVFTDVSGGNHDVAANAPYYVQNSTQVYVDGDTVTTIVLSEVDGGAPSKLAEWFTTSISANRKL